MTDHTRRPDTVRTTPDHPLQHPYTDTRVDTPLAAHAAALQHLEAALAGQIDDGAPWAACDANIAARIRDAVAPPEDTTPAAVLQRITRRTADCHATASAARGTCSVCNREYALRTDGMVRHHMRDQPGPQWERGTCAGAYEPPASWAHCSS
ncbi:hypothetical protein I5Q34_34215 [Streptomyces sp. AV19]|uniref:hypothetical protein n=1 Tax=Streptomyces sp. AV19 TaxID=2793068 RepID=UPI0018FE4B87|nr:hypothetical protein [Streptomyces sp. AV19]MBH1939256.1 hypothetical protein [Streptomyces sp. AV19]MDG4531644.1 hypothetical protein [Streptomyces sp. AV19]